LNDFADRAGDFSSICETAAGGSSASAGICIDSALSITIPIMEIITDDVNEYYAKRFVGLNLSRRELSAKEFEECEFRGCDFSETALTRCKFVDCHFIECNLSLVKVTSSKFREVALDDCKAVGINWTSAVWQKLAMSSSLKFRKCILNDSSFFGLTLEEFVIEDCKARDVDFREANLSGANCRHTDFADSLFGKTNLSRADFTEATNYDIDIFDNEIRHAKFCRFEAMRLLDCLEIELID
jgi:fluoroquinolone resistance protein